MLKTLKLFMRNVLIVTAVLSGIFLKILDTLDTSLDPFAIIFFTFLFSIVLVAFYEISEGRCPHCRKLLWPIAHTSATCPFCDHNIRLTEDGSLQTAPPDVGWTDPSAPEDTWECIHCGTQNKKIYSQCKSCGEYRSQ